MECQNLFSGKIIIIIIILKNTSICRLLSGKVKLICGLWSIFTLSK